VSTSEGRILALVNAPITMSASTASCAAASACGVDANRVMDAVDPVKDVDGFHPVNTDAGAEETAAAVHAYGVIRLAQDTVSRCPASRDVVALPTSSAAPWR